MTARSLALIFLPFSLLFSQSAQAQSQDIDEFDLGDEWVDLGNEGGWFTPFAPLFSSGAGGFRLDVSGGIGLDTERQVEQPISESAGGQSSTKRDYYALATLEIPFDRILGGRGRQDSSASRGDDSQLLAQYVGEGSDLDESRTDTKGSDEEGVVRRAEQRVESDRENEGDSSVGVSPEPQANDEEVNELETRLTEEEGLLIAREIADRVSAAMNGAEGRIRSLIRRSRWSGLSPELRLRGVLGFDRATSTEDSVGIYPGDTTVRGGRDSLAEVRLTFRLDQLVLGDGEASLERHRVELAEERRKLVREALKLFSDWRRASVRAGDVSLPPDDRVEAAIDAESTLGELHLLTGGWFQGAKTLRAVSRQLPNAGHN